MKRILSMVITGFLAGAFAFTGLAPASATSEKGPLHLTKECSLFTGHPGDYCTITKSNRKMIPIGSRVTYAAGPADGWLNTDIVLDTTPGNSAFGHVLLNANTGAGTVEFTGGTGTFVGFHASADVSYAGGVNYVWNGTYSFSPDD